MLVVLVSTADPGLEIFPTHRVFSGRPDVVPRRRRRLAPAPRRRSRSSAREPYDALGTRSCYRRRRRLAPSRARRASSTSSSSTGFGHEGIAYTADLDEAVARVDAGEADGAFLLRADPDRGRVRARARAAR